MKDGAGDMGSERNRESRPKYFDPFKEAAALSERLRKAAATALADWNGEFGEGLDWKEEYWRAVARYSAKWN